MKKLAVFASGNGTNFEAICDACNSGQLHAQVVLMVCDHPAAPVIHKALARQIPVFAFAPADYQGKADYEQAILQQCQRHGVEAIALAGYMRILSDTLLNAYQNQILNIHPALLPAFKGKDAIGQAWRYGVKVMGVSIHYVNAEMDGGRIIAQQAFDVPDGMSQAQAEARIHQIEHVLYPRTLEQLIKEGML